MAKTILITGCSSGIGLAAARTLYQRGYQVFASARKAADLEQLMSIGVNPVQLDLNEPDSISAAAKSVLEQTDGQLDALFNNAGFIQAGAIEDLSAEAIQRQFQSNVFGPIALTQLLIPAMRARGQGRIIFNSSILGVCVLPFRGLYSASKYALEAFADALRLELTDSGILVSLIEPGPIASNLRQNAFAEFKAAIDITQSKHQHTYQAMEAYFTNNVGDGALTLPADAVVKQLLHALTAKRPRTRYFTGFGSKFLAICKRILPTRTNDYIAFSIVK